MKKRRKSGSEPEELPALGNRPGVAPPQAVEQALEAFNGGRLEEAEHWCRLALGTRPAYFDALHLLGYVLLNAHRPAEAIGPLAKAVSVRPGDPDAQNNLGNALRVGGRASEALGCYEKAIRIDRRNAKAHFNRGLALLELQREPEALGSFDAALSFEPGFADAINARGMALQRLGRTREAIASFEQAVAADPDFAEAHFNLGGALQSSLRNRPAIECYDRALALRPDYAKAHNNRGIAFGDLGLHREAIECFRSVLAIDPAYPYARGALFHARAAICEWEGREAALGLLRSEILQGQSACSPIVALAAFDDPALHAKVARTWSLDKYPAKVADPRFPLESGGSDGRIHLGYFSADLRDHPVAQQAAGLFESHDRGRFRVTAFSFASGDSAMRARLEAAFDAFVDASGMTDAEVHAKARELGIDIAVDLGGFTQGARTGVFAMRVAPVQVNYLGFAGTMACDYMDYLVADRRVIPESQQAHYSEKIAFLPHTFMPTDSTRRRSGKEPDRRDLGLPAAGFVFCSFNNAFKLNPVVFDCWMRLLKSVEGSVLWLSDPGLPASENLRHEATRRDVAADRLVFAPRVPALEDHLARIAAADLFLDTWPYNAHSSACDALWAGVPVLTYCGNAYSARVAASLLEAVGLGELITASLPAYEAAALEIASDEVLRRTLREKLDLNKANAPLFDTKRFVKNIETAFELMHARSARASGPETFDVIE